MKPDGHWTDRFDTESTVVLTPENTDDLVEREVYSVGEDELYFLIDESSDVLEAFRFENTVWFLRPGEGLAGTGTVQIIDVDPSAYEQESGTHVEFDQSEYHLLRLDVEKLTLPDGSAKVIDRDRPSGPVAWMKACRFYSLSASLVPMLLGIVYAAWMSWGISLPLSLLALVGGVLLHLATNLHNDVSDHLRGIDQYADYGGSGVIQKGWVSARKIWMASLGLYALGTLCGLPLIWIRGSKLLVVGALGFLGACTYSLEHYGTKYSGLGDFAVFVLMGPLMAVGTSLAASGTWSWNLVLVSLPIGFFVALILHSNNIHDIPIDRRAGATTLAILLGFQASKTYYLFLLFAGYATIGFLALLGLIPAMTLLSWLTVPLALRHLQVLRSAENPLNPDLGALRFKAARLHLLVGLLYVLGFTAALVVQ